MPDAVMVSAEAALSACKEGHIIQAGNPTHLRGRCIGLARQSASYGMWYEVTGDPDDPNAQSAYVD